MGLKKDYILKEKTFQVQLWKEKNFKNQKFEFCKMGRMTLYKCLFEECNFKECIFLNCTFIDCVFLACIGDKLSIVQCTLEGTILDLKKSRNTSLGGNILKSNSVIQLPKGVLII